MALNIKNEETRKLTKALAKLTGESMTAAITEAVRERLDRVRGEHGTNLADRLVKIGKRLRGASTGTLPVCRSWGVAVQRKRVATMNIDASAIIAILRDEPEARSCAEEAIASANSRRVSAVNYVEGSRGHRRKPKSYSLPAV